MRDYDLHIAKTSDELPEQGLLIRLWRSWVARRAIASLNELDDHLLNDIGVDRRDIIVAATTPLSRNALKVLKASHQRDTWTLPQCKMPTGITRHAGQLSQPS